MLTVPLSSRRLLLTLVLPLILLFYFGSLAVAAWNFPQPYDWRYRVISNLLSPRDNPHFFRIPSFGIALAGLLLLPLTVYFERRMRPVSRRLARFSSGSLAGAIVMLILAALVVPQHVRPVLGLRRLHETLARTAALGFGLAMLSAIACAWRDRRHEEGPRFDRRLLPLWCCLTLLPIAGILASETLLLAARAWPAWGAPIKETMRQSVFWHLGFWEWLGSAAIFCFLTIAVWLLPE